MYHVKLTLSTYLLPEMGAFSCSWGKVFIAGLFTRRTSFLTP
nr:MAG TPA: hypothetical protein [Caudoviricetes sp.]